MDQGEYTALAAALADVPDPRARRGVRHTWGLLLVLIGAALLATGELEEETTDAVTSLTPALAGAAQVEGLWRGHWTIENKLHDVRDVTLGEDANQAHTASTPQALADLRNAVLGLLRARGWTSIADAVRHFAAHPRHALQVLGALSSGL